MLFDIHNSLYMPRVAEILEKSLPASEKLPPVKGLNHAKGEFDAGTRGIASFKTFKRIAQHAPELKVGSKADQKNWALQQFFKNIYTSVKNHVEEQTSQGNIGLRPIINFGDKQSGLNPGNSTFQKQLDIFQQKELGGQDLFTTAVGGKGMGVLNPYEKSPVLTGPSLVKALALNYVASILDGSAFEPNAFPLLKRLDVVRKDCRIFFGEKQVNESHISIGKNIVNQTIPRFDIR
jgi:hypothetical protein